MDIFSKDPEKVAAELGFQLLGPNQHEKIFKDISKYIGLQSVKNEMLRKSIQMVLQQLPEVYLELQQRAKKNSATGNNEIHMMCPKPADRIISSYIRGFTPGGDLRSLLKEVERKALRRITEDIFGCIKQAGAKLSVEPFTGDIIVKLPYDVAENAEHGDEEVNFWYKISLDTQENRKQITYKHINTFMDNFENQLKRLSAQKHKKEIGGILGSVIGLIRTPPSRTVEVPNSVATALTRIYRKASGGLLHSQREREEYHEYVTSRLLSLSQEYGCIFEPYTREEHHRITITPDRDKDDTLLIY